MFPMFPTDMTDCVYMRMDVPVMFSSVSQIRAAGLTQYIGFREMLQPLCWFCT